MIPSEWVAPAVNMLGGAIVLGTYIGIVRGLQQDRKDDRQEAADWRREMKGDMAEVRTQLQTLLTTTPVTNERIGHLQTEQDFQRGRLHEFANQMARIDAKHDERFNALARGIDRLAAEKS